MPANLYDISVNRITGEAASLADYRGKVLLVTIDHAPVFPREIIRRAFELNATALILIHNHPSGDPSPSQTDIQMTRQIVSLGKSLNVAVHDHLIIGRDGFTSFKSLQLI